MIRSFNFLSLGTAALLASVSPASAHAKLEKSDPSANSVKHIGPKSITLSFNERLVPAFSKFALSMPAHHMAVPVKTTVSADGKRIVGALPSRLSAGVYVVEWTAASADDGHKMTGKLNFRVG